MLRYSTIRKKIPHYKDGIHTLVDLDWKFDTTGKHSKFHQHYCNFDIFINGRAYYVDATSIFQQHFNQITDDLWEKYSPKKHEFVNVLDVSETINNEAWDKMKELMSNSPDIFSVASITLKQCPGYVYVKVNTNIIFDSFEKVQGNYRDWETDRKSVV